MGKRICRKHWYFVLKFHLIMCFHFKLQQLCHLRMFSHLLVNTSSEACFIRERQLLLFDSRDHSGFCSMIMWDRTTQSLPPRSRIDALWGIPTHHTFTDLSCSTLCSTQRCIFIKTMEFVQLTITLTASGRTLDLFSVNKLGYQIEQL